LGSDIFIRGNNVSIRCIAIDDEAIKELIILAHYAIQNKIEVIISSRDLG